MAANMAAIEAQREFWLASTDLLAAIVGGGGTGGGGEGPRPMAQAEGGGH